MKKTKISLAWIKNNLLFTLSTFLIAFIPLFPKIPLFDILPGYIVRVRAEDFLILFAAIIWLRDAYQKKFSWNTSFLWLVAAYALVGLTSIFLSTILLQSIPSELLHIGKSGLHFFRYMEYFALFFFLYSSVKTKQHIKIILVTLVVTLIGVIGYGFGQQYLRFPLYSTMNREYSKGEKLYLQENARPQSTFAGHYDLGAYLVIVLPIIFALSISLPKISPFKKDLVKKRATQLILHLAHLSGAWMLVTSGSKTALAAYLVGILTVLFFYLRKMEGFKQKLKWGGIALLALTIGLGLILTIFGQETETALISIAQNNAVANKIISKIPGVELQQKVGNLSRPEDLYGEGHEFKLEIVTDDEGNETKTIVAEESNWSENALKYGISMGIRLDALWPQAVKGLINNPLFGNGYGTLSNFSKGQFTEADSTDNNFLRTLGETGLLGFITFYGLIIYILTIIYKNTKKTNPLIVALNIGLTGSIIGLLINATYIDVFAASKVAFTFWALVGLGAKSGSIDKEDSTKKNNTFILSILNHLKKHFAFYISFLLLFFLLHKNPYQEDSLIRNFKSSNEAIENIVSAKCYIETGSFSVCSNNGLVLKNNSGIYSFLLVPFLRINSDPATFYFLNFSLLIVIFLSIYKAIVKIVRNNESSTNSNLIKFTSLLTAVFIFYLTAATGEPLIFDNLLMLAILTPFLTILLTKFLVKRKRKYFTVTTQVLVLLFISTSLVKIGFISDVKTSFRNDKKAYKNWTVERSNFHFDSKSLSDGSKNNYLVSVINPYYFDFYKNDNYEVLPMSEHQPYFNQAEKVWADVDKTYESIVENKDRLYITDYGIYQDTNYLNSFNKIKKTYDLKYEVIDCDEQCNIYNIETAKEKVSDVPVSINNKGFNLGMLSGNYTFSVFSNELDTKENPSNPPYNATALVRNLFSSDLSKTPQDFAIFTGDILYKDEDSWEQIFNSSFGNIANYPILYNSKNSPNYHRFFSKNDYYIFLDLTKESEISMNQRLFVYNAFLELEKLPDIKNIFIIAQNLDWQDTSSETNFIHSLEKKLFNFPGLNKYIVTNNNDGSFEYENNESANTHYFANLTNDTDRTSYLQFSVNESSEVSFKEVVN